MNCEKISATIKFLRLQNNMTQKQLAEKMGVTEQAVSKWERGAGLPDIGSCSALAEILGVNVEVILTGNLDENDEVKSVMKNLNYYICPVCGNVIVSLAAASISCCGRPIQPAEIKKADEHEKMNVAEVENDYYITCSHPMTKDDYISFTALVSGESIEFLKHYPEWDFSVRIPKFRRGKFIWYSKKAGLFYQLL